MRIISKFKDYYDHLKGVYGVDEKLILDRTTFNTLLYPQSDYTIENFYIGNYQIQGLWMGDKLYWGDEIKQFHNDELSKSFKNKGYWYIKKPRTYRHLKVLKTPFNLGDKCPTWQEDCPILRAAEFDKYLHHPILSEYNIHKILPAHDIWLILSEWLSQRITKNEPDVPIGDDKIRILSAGFHLKTSFRHRKNK